MIRLDVALVERGLVGSRSRASDLVKRGLVKVNGKVETTVSRKVTADDQLTLPAREGDRVSRAGEKLAAILRRYQITVSGWALDVGASTGGFTQELLNAGASKVVALDVGHGQLHASLKQDSRVIDLSGINFRDVTLQWLAETLGKEPDFRFVSVDVSFISLRQILPVVIEVAPKADVAVLIKPQFEVGRDGLDGRGVVKSLVLRNEAVRGVIQFADALGYRVKGFMPTPVRGEHGNQEFILWISPEGRQYPQQ